MGKLVVPVSGGSKATINTTSINRMFTSEFDSFDIKEMDPDTMKSIINSHPHDQYDIRDTGALGNRLFQISRAGSSSVYNWEIREFDPDTLLVLQSVEKTDENMFGIDGTSTRLFHSLQTNDTLLEIDTDTLLTINSNPMNFDIGGVGGNENRLFAADDWSTYRMVEVDPDTLLEINNASSPRMGSVSGYGSKLFAKEITGDKVIEFDPDTLLEISSVVVGRKQSMGLAFLKTQSQVKTLIIEELVDNESDVFRIKYNNELYY